MAIGINWAEVWKPVWKAVWRTVATEPPAPPPQLFGGGGYVKGQRYGLLTRPTKERLAELVKAQREALGILPKPAQKRIVAAAKKAAAKPEGLQLLAPVVVDVAMSAQVPAVDIAKAMERSFAYALELHKAKASISAAERSAREQEAAEQERVAHEAAETQRAQHLERLKADDDALIARMADMHRQVAEAMRNVHKQLLALLNSGSAAPG